MKIHSYNNALAMLGAMRKYVETTGIHVKREPDDLFYISWINVTQDEVWELRLRYFSPSIKYIRNKIKKNKFRSWEQKQWYKFVEDTIYYDGDYELLDKYLNYGPKILKLLPFT
jgi:hypothetical protein